MYNRHDSGERMNSKLEAVYKGVDIDKVSADVYVLIPASISCVPLNRDRLYKVVCTLNCWFKAVLYDSIVCTDTARVTTEYIPVCTLN
jgi:hypothetical protein